MVRAALDPEEAEALAEPMEAGAVLVGGTPHCMRRGSTPSRWPSMLQCLNIGSSFEQPTSTFWHARRGWPLRTSLGRPCSQDGLVGPVAGSLAKAVVIVAVAVAESSMNPAEAEHERVPLPVVVARACRSTI